MSATILESTQSGPSFPYLVLTSRNRRQYAATKASRGDPNSKGYMGWRLPGSNRIMEAGQPLTEVIPRSQWVDLINASQGNCLSDLVKKVGIPVKDQNGLGYCWVYGSTSTVEIARAKAGLPFVQLAPESVGGPCTGWRNQGGYAQEAFDYLESHGACAMSFLDKPCSLNWRAWQQGWQADALKRTVTKWYDIGNEYPIFDEVISCLLNRLPVAAGLDWWGHLIHFLDAVILPDGIAPANTPQGKTVGVLARNSWGTDWPGIAGLVSDGWFCLDEDSATPDGAASPIVVSLAQ